MLSGSETESEVSNCDNGNPGPFMCEICFIEDDKSSAVFKELYHLMVHTRKKHPTACVGCYEQFESTEKMMEHLELVEHERLLMCRWCLILFPDADMMATHKCEAKAERPRERVMIRESISESQVSEFCEEEDNAPILLPSFIKLEEPEDDVEGNYGLRDRSSGEESDEGREEDGEETGPFLCEICDSGKGDSSAVFKERYHLTKHILKRHATSCPGCFQEFESTEEMHEHVRCVNHDLPVCLECWTVFSDAHKRDTHACGRVKWTKSKYVREKNKKGSQRKSVDEENARESSPARFYVKIEPTSDSDESDYESEEELSSDDESGEEDLACETGNTLSCLHCPSRDFFSQSELRLHTYEKHATVCRICFEECDDEESLHHHQNAMKHEVWHCKRCNKLFVERSKYRTHTTIFHVDDCPLRCSYCETFGTFRETHLRVHMRKMHREQLTYVTESPRLKLDWHIPRTVCSLCQENFFTSYSLLLHMFEYHNEPDLTHVFKCEICDLGFGRGKGFEAHLKDCHADDTEYLEEAQLVMEKTLQRSTSCKACGVTFPTEKALTRHVYRNHPSLRPHKCNICGAGFPEETDLRVHSHKDHNGPSPNVCPVCSLTCRGIFQLEKHLVRRHQYKGLPKCYCFTHKRRFLTTAQLRVHVNAVHLKIKSKYWGSYPCDICGKVFTTSHIMVRHREKAHGPRIDLKCDECGKIYHSHVFLKLHKNKHTDIYKCNVCGKRFEAKANLDRHMVVHSGEKPFVCELCGIRVTQKSSLLRHQKVVHPDGKVKKNARAVFQRRSRGPIFNRTERRSTVDGEANAQNRADNLEKDSKPSESSVEAVEPKTKRGRRKKRQRESSSSDADIWDISNMDTNEPAAEPNPRKRERRSLMSYREASSSDSDEKGITEKVTEHDISNGPRKASDAKLQDDAPPPPPKKRRGRPPKKAKLNSLV